MNSWATWIEMVLGPASVNTCGADANTAHEAAMAGEANSGVAENRRPSMARMMQRKRPLRLASPNSTTTLNEMIDLLDDLTRP